MATRPIGENTENLTVNVRKGLPSAYTEVAKKLGISRNQLLQSILMDAMETGVVYEIPVKRLRAAAVRASKTKIQKPNDER